MIKDFRGSRVKCFLLLILLLLLLFLLLPLLLLILGTWRAPLSLPLCLCSTLEARTEWKADFNLY